MDFEETYTIHISLYDAPAAGRLTRLFHANNMTTETEIKALFDSIVPIPNGVENPADQN